MKLSAAAALLLLAAPARSSELSRMARELGEAARAAGLKRVAVSPLLPSRGRDDGRGAVITERLVVALVRDGRVQAVERGLLPELAEEVTLARTGAVAGGARRGVRLAAADGMVVGRWARENGRLRVWARVVSVEGGLIAGAASASLEDVEPAIDPFDVPVPSLASGFPLSSGEELRDAPSQGEEKGCAGAAGRVVELQERNLELKARYWAFRLRLGLPGGDVTVNPGTTIPDAELRARFYDRLGALSRSERPEPMTEDELRRLADSEGESYSLVRDCGL